jgi:hypothetical protein
LAQGIDLIARLDWFVVDGGLSGLALRPAHRIRLGADKRCVFEFGGAKPRFGAREAIVLSGKWLCRPISHPLDCGKATVLGWLARHQEFRNSYELAQTMVLECLMDETLEIVDDVDGDWIEKVRPGGSPAPRPLPAAGQCALLGRGPDGAGKAPEGSGETRKSSRAERCEKLSLRESLIEQMAAINSADEAAAWAHRNLPAKNTLIAADAKMVEEQFRERLSAIGAPDGICGGPAACGTPGSLATNLMSHLMRPRTKPWCPVGQTRLPARRHRRRPGNNRAAARSVFWAKRFDCAIRSIASSCCGSHALCAAGVPSDPHHLTFTQPRALGRRVSDEFTVPVCRVHHRELHRSADEAAWWQKLNIDPLPVALRLWQHTRADGELPNGRRHASAGCEDTGRVSSRSSRDEP